MRTPQIAGRRCPHTGVHPQGPFNIGSFISFLFMQDFSFLFKQYRQEAKHGILQ
jgi:hypothetical protein